MIISTDANEATLENKSKPMLSSLQGLRVLAYVAIFICHAGIGTFEALGAWGVSVFFVLSGFVMMYSYYDRGGGIYLS